MSAQDLRQRTLSKRFEIVRRIGAGGIGLVYEAIDHHRNSRVALKTLRQLNSDALLRFKSEFRLLQGIHHPNLIHLGELFEADGYWFFTMELLDGCDFQSYVTEGTCSAPSRTISHGEVAGAGMEPGMDPGLADKAARVAEQLTQMAATGDDLETVPANTDGADNNRAPTAIAAQAAPSGIHQHSTVVVDDSSAATRSREHASTASEPAHPNRGHHYSEARLRGALRQLVDGLCALHQAGMVHRDIKPHNVMVCGDRVVVLDFGLVGAEQSWHARDIERGLIMGTPLYMSPEQAAGQAATPASDWYSVGVLLYEALTGTLPFTGTRVYVLAAKQQTDPLPPSARAFRLDASLDAGSDAIPWDLEDLCMQLLRRDPAGRPDGRAILARLAGARSPAAAPRRRPGTDRKSPFVGRQRELATLRAALAQCRADHPVVALVHGASGMGKTALIDHFARWAYDHAGALVLRGHCYEREDVPYKAFDGVIDDVSRALKQLAKVRKAAHRRSHPGADEVSLHSSDAAGQGQGGLSGSRIEVANDILIPQRFSILARLFPVLEWIFGNNADSAADSCDPSELRRAAFVAIKEFFALLATRRPLVVAIDDLQWGDLDSAALLAELLAPPNAPGLLLIGGYRSEECESALVASLRAQAHRSLAAEQVTELAVGPLANADSHALAMAIWQHIGFAHGSESENSRQLGELAGLVTREASGSPFFVGEIGRYLANSARDGAIDTSHATFERVLAARCDRLEPAARALLEVVAVAGQPIAQGVVLRAAGLDSAVREPLDILRAGHFVRTRGPGLDDPVEIYHDRIREAVVAQVKGGATEVALRGQYRRLATALEDWGSSDAEMLTRCHCGAGQFERAVQWARQAADKAEAALAFDRAAQMYQLILSAAPISDRDRCEVQIRLGDALAHANRSAAAAAAYLAAAALSVVPRASAPQAEAASEVAGDLAIECQRRAAEHLFRSGNIKRGLALLDQLVSAAKLSVPKSDQGALLSLLMRRLQLRVRGFGYRRRDARAMETRARRHFDICWTGAVGLLAVEPMRGADFATRGLLIALQQGDEVRIARTLAMVAGQLAVGGNASATRVAAMIRVASEIAERVADPLAVGAAELATGSSAMLTGYWRRARASCERAESIFREQCRGVSWEIGTARTFLFTALYYLGDWALLRQRTWAALREAQERNDAFTIASLASFAAYSCLLKDDVAGARRAVEHSRLHWQVSDYHLQNYYQLLAHLQIDLYEGNGAIGLQRLATQLRRLGKLLVKRVQTLRIVMAHTRARCALSVAAAQPANAEPLLRIAMRATRAIEREHTHWGAPMAAAVRAAVAACRGDENTAASQLTSAIAGFDAADMGFFASAARLRLGWLIGGTTGLAYQSDGLATMQSQGLRSPERLTDMLVPGFVPPG